MPSNSVGDRLWGMPSSWFQSSQVILKLKLDQAKLILIAPAWPRQCWFSDLLSVDSSSHISSSSFRPTDSAPLSSFASSTEHCTSHDVDAAWLFEEKDNVWKLFNSCGLAAGSYLLGWLFFAKWKQFSVWSFAQKIQLMLACIQNICSI